MIEGLRPYADMVATDVDWMPKVPAHWSVRRIKTVLREVDRRTPTGDERLLSLRMIAGLIDHHDAGGKLIPATALVGYKMIEPGQIVMNRMRAASGLFGLAQVAGLVSPDYAVFEQSNPVDCQYLLRLFKLPQMSAIFRAESKGLGTGESGFLRLYTDRFGPIPIPLPPLDEQRLIVRFLDWHGGMTARLIRAKKRLIALLNEQKQSIIHHAVTRGLDPAAPFKPSGVDWLGDVPAGWELKRLKRVCRFAYGDALATDKRTDGTVEVYGSNGPVGRHNLSNTAAPAIVIGRKGSFGKVNWSDVPVFVIDTAFHVPLTTTRVNPRWLFHILSSAELDTVSNDTAIPGLSRQDAYDRMLPVPPSFDEQAAVAASIDEATSEADTAIAVVHNEITFIQEFRTRLIADVVTGQLDVRALAATLPAETVATSLDDLIDGDEADEDANAFEAEEASA